MSTPRLDLTGDINYSILFTGDSITALYFWYLGVTNAIVNRFARRYGANSPRIPPIYNSAISGRRVADIDSDFQNTIGKYNARVVIIFIGANDVGGVPTGVGPATGATAFTTSWNSIVDKIRAIDPNCQIVMCTPWAYFEKWPTGQNPRDTELEALVTACVSIATARQLVLVNFRRGAYEANEAVYNPTNLSSGVLIDGFGLHPNSQTAKDLLCADLMAQIDLPDEIPIRYPTDLLAQFEKNIELVTSASPQGGGFTRSAYRFTLENEPSSIPDGTYFLDVDSITPRSRHWGSGENLSNASVVVRTAYKRPGGTLGGGDRQSVMRNAADDCQRIADVCENPANYDGPNTGIRTIHYEGSQRVVDKPLSEIWESRFTTQWDTTLSVIVDDSDPLDPPGDPLIWFDGQNIDGTGNNNALTHGQAIARWVNLGSLGAAADAVQGTSASMPTFRRGVFAGKDAVLGNGSQWLASQPFTAVTQPYLVLAIFRMTDLSALGIVYAGSVDGSQRELEVAPTTGLLSLTNSSTQFVSTGQSVTAATWRSSLASFNNTESFHYLDGAVSAPMSTGTVGFAGITLLGENLNFRAKAHLAEFVTWIGSWPLVSDIHTWVTTKYGSLPST